MARITLSEDRRSAVLEADDADGAPARLDAAAIDRLIAELAAVRAQMAPPFSGRFRTGETPAHDCDNLLWEIQADPSRRGVTIAFQHAGFGWLSLRLSRAQIEDLITSIEFTLAGMPDREAGEGNTEQPDGSLLHQGRKT
ncbi:MAG: hypothetical protein JO000_17590 [Alphaproteobacteria bacterium]|nr:hypothetical protein [Alphaproteobacteria bacterium]